MMKRLLMSTAAASLLALGSVAYGQSTAPADNGQAGQPPVVTPQPSANDSAGSGATMTAPATNPNGIDQAAPAPAASATPATPPPTDAVISAQTDTQVRADQLIGMTVFNDKGEKVGTVHDIILGKDGKAAGVVLSVGGVLGIGAKSVGLTWKEVDVKPDQQAVQISYTKDQLEAAPDFKTTDQINSEMNAQQPPAPGGGLGTAPSPNPGQTQQP